MALSKTAELDKSIAVRAEAIYEDLTETHGWGGESAGRFVTALAAGGYFNPPWEAY